MKVNIEIDVPDSGPIEAAAEVGRILLRLAMQVKVQGLETVNCTAVKNSEGQNVGEIYLSVD